MVMLKVYSAETLEKLINMVHCMYNTKTLHEKEAIRILATGYLPISLITPLKLKDILDAVKTTIRKMNPDYDIVI